MCNQKELQDPYVQKKPFFHAALGIEGKFNALSGWLTRFKALYRICKKVAVKGENFNINMDAAKALKQN